MARVSRFAVEFEIPSQPGKVWLAEFRHAHAATTCPHTPEHIQMGCRCFNDAGRRLHTALSCPHPKGHMVCPTPKVIPVDYRIEHGPDVGKHIPVQHVTSVKLRHVGSTVFLSGSAPCSLHDEYNWRVGLHLALQRACEKGGYIKLEKVKTCQCGDGHTAQGISEGDCPQYDGILRIVDRKPIYDEICEAFHREMRLTPSGKPGVAEKGAPSRASAAQSAKGSGNSATPMLDAHSGGGTLSGRIDALRAAGRRHGIVHGMGAVSDGDIPPENRNGLHYSGCD